LETLDVILETQYKIVEDILKQLLVVELQYELPVGMILFARKVEILTWLLAFSWSVSSHCAV
jgi:hypothetical protein